MKETLISKAEKEVENGAKFHIDFLKKSIIVNKKFIVKDGKYEGVLTDVECFSIGRLEELYQIYKHSRPSERSENKRKNYFKALRLNELDDDDMLFGVDREVAQFNLESYLLCWILSGLFVWDDSMGKWFWQSKKDKDLVILRSWVENTQPKNE